MTSVKDVINRNAGYVSPKSGTSGLIRWAGAGVLAAAGVLFVGHKLNKPAIDAVPTALADEAVDRAAAKVQPDTPVQVAKAPKLD